MYNKKKVAYYYLLQIIVLLREKVNDRNLIEKANFIILTSYIRERLL